MDVKEADPFRAHKMQSIISHLELRAGKEWDNLYQELVHKECLELTTADMKRLRSKSDEYQAMETKMRTSTKELKILADQVKCKQLKNF